MKKIVSIALALALIVSLCGCSLFGKDEDTASVESETTKEPKTYTDPLTGETLSEKPENTRPFAVMINNIQVALPHCGTSEADILYEVLAEGDITRMLAVFGDVSSVEKIGSMRSARPYYIELAQSYDAIYVHAGGSEQAYSDLSTKGIDHLDGVRETYKASVFYRDKNRMKNGYEHSLFTSGEGILAGVAEKNYDLDHSGKSYDYGLNFVKDGEEVDMGESASIANDVNVSFGGIKNSKLTYDDTTKLYTFSEYNKEITDGNNDQHLTFSNVLVVFADTKIIDDYGRRSVNLLGEGTGKFICNGKCINITWKHKSDDDCFTYYDENGNDITLAIGKTYIAVVPTGSEIGLA